MEEPRLMGRVYRKGRQPMGWLIDSERLESCETVESLRAEVDALVASGVPSGAVLERFDVAAWYRRRLTE